MSGVTGAFLILPFQVSVLGFASPAVSPTNLFYNLIAIPGGVLRYIREKRMFWPLAYIMILGSLPGIFAGVICRVKLLPDPRNFKLFAGFVLLYLGLRLILDVIKQIKTVGMPDRNLQARELYTELVEFKISRIRFKFYGQEYSLSCITLFIISGVVGLVGGIYGVGGGAFLVPVLITVFKIPVYVAAGPALITTFVASLFGVLFYTIIAPCYAPVEIAVCPDWLLGFLFGIGGFFGVYIGAILQRKFPVRMIKIILTAVILFVALKYISVIFI